MPVIAVIGASNDRRKYGNKALRLFRARGYTVVPVNPKEATVEGEPAYRSVLEYPGRIDEATMYVPPQVGEAVLDELAAKQVPVVWFNPGAESPALLARARALALKPIVACSITAMGESPDSY